MLNTRAKQVLSPVLSRFHELEISHGKGCYLTATDGTDYLDFGSGIAVTSTGHCHPKVVAAIQRQAETLIHPCIAMGNTEPVIACAEKLTEIAQPTPTHVFFDQSGSGAVEAAIKCAKFVTKRQNIVAFKGGFHGRSLGALSLTTSKESYRQDMGPFIEGIDFFPYPYSYRCPWNTNGASDEACTEECINALNTSPLFTEDVAAVIIEPILGEAGYVPAPIPFLQALETKCREKGILLIVDEIQTGIGRTGHWLAFQKANLAPDIIVTAKGLGSGMPISACIMKEDLSNQWTAGSHGGTYGGNPVTCAAASATLDIIEPLLPTIRQHEHTALKLLTQALQDHPFIGDIRCNGLMLAMECVKDKTTKEPHPQMATKIMKEALKHNLIIMTCGLHSNVIRCAPPLIISQDLLESGLNTLCQVIHGYH